MISSVWGSLKRDLNDTTVLRMILETVRLMRGTPLIRYKTAKKKKHKKLKLAKIHHN